MFLASLDASTPVNSPATPTAALLDRPDVQRGLAWLLLVLIAVISYLALSPAPPKQMNLGWDKLNHLSAFATLALLGRLAWPRRTLVVPLALLAYGAAIEVLQSQVPGRSGEWPDLLADALGLLLGSLASWALSRLLRPAPHDTN